MLFEDFRKTYILSDGQVLNMAIDFDQSVIRTKLNVQKLVGPIYERHEIEIWFENTFELDLLETFDEGWHTDVVFVRIETGDFYISFDPFGNSGMPHENDNFIIKCRQISVSDGGEPFRLN